MHQTIHHTQTNDCYKNNMHTCEYIKQYITHRQMTVIKTICIHTNTSNNTSNNTSHTDK